MISIFTNTQQTDWDESLSLLTFAYITSIQDTTRFSPFNLVYGREQSVKSDDALKLRDRAGAIRSLAVDNVNKRKAKDKRRFGKRHRHVEYDVGDDVKVFTSTRKVVRSEKLLLKWFGPYTITKKTSEVTYEIKGEIQQMQKGKLFMLLESYTPPVDPGD
ncbi:uncharacterized protein [Leptinotarsa decemlineata]|uniref:uncharacterized protein n=1 Tax=Leptinotarsa decemlineata TaxID=7539 RepID=UPI003D309F3D